MVTVMSNSSLASKSYISPFTSQRVYPITKITIHCSAGVSDAEAICRVVENRQVSCNYAIGVDGDICLGAGEDRRAWCSGNYDNDQRSVNIEVSNSDIKAPDLPVSDKSFEALISLCVDICRRNGIDKLVFTGDKNGNLTAHRMFSNKSCPGDYLYSRFPEIAQKVNDILQEGLPMTDAERKEFEVLKKQIAEQSAIIDKLLVRTDKIKEKYNWFDALPDYAKPTFKKLLDAGIFKGSSDGQYHLTDDTVRVMVMLDRAGVLNNDIQIQ